MLSIHLFVSNLMTIHYSFWKSTLISWNPGVGDGDWWASEVFPKTLLTEWYFPHYFSALFFRITFRIAYLLFALSTFPNTFRKVWKVKQWERHETLKLQKITCIPELLSRSMDTQKNDKIYFNNSWTKSIELGAGWRRRGVTLLLSCRYLCIWYMINTQKWCTIC